MARNAYKRLDRTTDAVRKNGDRVRTYNVHNGADDSIIGSVTEHWHAAKFDNGVVDMSAYKNSVADGRRTFAARTIDGKNVDSGNTLARTVANVRIAAIGK